MKTISNISNYIKQSITMIVVVALGLCITACGVGQLNEWLDHTVRLDLNKHRARHIDAMVYLTTTMSVVSNCKDYYERSSKSGLLLDMICLTDSYGYDRLDSVSLTGSSKGLTYLAENWPIYPLEVGLPCALTESNETARLALKLPAPPTPI